MEIQIDPHTLACAVERGASEEEIREVINAGFSVPAKYGRMGKGKIYTFQNTRHGRYYEQKRVEVFYIVERSEIVTVTIYVFYGKWEQEHADSL